MTMGDNKRERFLGMLGKARVCEGAMGTMLFAQGAKFGDDLMSLNVEKPDMVRRVHELYHEAGATVAITNSFTPCTSEDPADQEEAARRIQASVDLARDAGAEIVLGDASPCSYVLEPLGPAEFDHNLMIYRRHLRNLSEAGADAFLLETFIDIADLRCAIIAAREVDPDMPIVASCTFDQDLTMALSSTTPEAAAVVCSSLGVDVVGVNCGFGPEKMLEVVERMSAVTNLPLIVQPNAGLPEYLEDGTTHYPGTPDELAAFAPRYVECGAAIVGSCCGSTPEFTAALSRAIGDGRAPLREARPTSSLSELIASISDVLHVPDDLSDLESGLEFDCAEPDFDRWDILENVSECPFVVMSSANDGYARCLDALERVLRLYPGRAIARIDAEDTEARSIAARYGALVAE